MEVPDYYEDMSLRLMRVLDTTGLREKARWKRIAMWQQAEEMLRIKCNNGDTVHIFGSQAEATTIHSLRSDIDIVYCLKIVTLLQDLQFWARGLSVFLVITDDTTPPGYVKLQRVLSHVPVPVCNAQTSTDMLDRNERSVLYNNHSIFKRKHADEHHGPANTNYIAYDISMDKVIALNLLSWPYTASEWITRRRTHNWPSQETISIIQKTGALLVPVGQILSPEKHLEWRISLSYGEKILVWQFNSTQYRCYVLLKMINKHFIKPKVGENVLSSYHCKTCMFYVIETTPTALWQPQNLLLCIDLCLIMLCTWVEKRYCPNYFIPAENMFLGKVHDSIQSNLTRSLRDLLRQKGRYLTMIPYGGIGQKLIRVCMSPHTQIDDVNTDIYFSLIHVHLMISDTWFCLLNEGVQEHPSILQRTFHSHGVRKEINTILTTFVCSSIGSYLASKCMQQEVIDQEGLGLAHEFLLLGSCSDVASGKLKLAACYLMEGNIVLAETILQNIEENYTFLVSNTNVWDTNDLILHRIINENISTTDVFRNYYAFPVPYLQSEIQCTPGALIPEMFRSTGSCTGSLDPDLDYWQSWAVVDPKLYLHFLEHQCYHRQNKIRHKMVALENIIWVIQKEELQYKDTALNLLAYCLEMEGLVMQAHKVLSMSMKLKNHRNAAKWQIAYLLCAAFRLGGGTDFNLQYSLSSGCISSSVQQG
ncbi:hypothetical protein CHS0354_036201 [Potamilus streckersoni]|uniref:Mab-21-like HhH/H2TH-like domain-containing protein n=1 Tax=Potamilus streckersoni TaxID=2493646 RepID=A0AAE0SW85_9BIVA|nr:hypothetical protein CHS0354_036201 [Potamilus streckersoni]